MKRVWPTRSTQRGFTLVEVLVGAALAIVIVGMLLTVSLQVMGYWNRLGGGLAAAAQGRVVLDQLESDLRAAIWRDDGKTWMAADILTDTQTSGVWVAAANPKPAGSLDVTSATIAECRFGVAGVWLRFFTSSNDDTRGYVRAVSYQIVRRNITASPNSEMAYELYRSEVSGPNTFSAGFDLHPQTGNYTTPAATSEAIAGTIIRPHRNKILADHVVDFGIRFFRREGGVLVPHFPASGGNWSNTASGFRLIAGGSGAVTATQPPVLVEIMVRILTEEGARLLNQLEAASAWSGPSWWEVVEKHSKVFVRRVQL